MMSVTDLLGWGAAALTLLAFSQVRLVSLRMTALAANVAFIAYGLSASLWPVAVLHLVLVPVNTLRLWQAFSAGARVGHDALAPDLREVRRPRSRLSQAGFVMAARLRPLRRSRALEAFRVLASTAMAAIAATAAIAALSGIAQGPHRAEAPDDAPDAGTAPFETAPFAAPPFGTPPSGARPTRARPSGAPSFGTRPPVPHPEDAPPVHAPPSRASSPDTSPWTVAALDARPGDGDLRTPAEAAAIFRRFVLNVFLAPLIDDDEPPRWTAVGIDWFCGPKTRVQVDGQLLRPGRPLPAGAFSVRWVMDDCLPLNDPLLQSSGIVELQVIRRGERLDALVDTRALRINGALVTTSSAQPFAASMSMGGLAE